MWRAGNPVLGSTGRVTRHTVVGLFAVQLTGNAHPVDVAGGWQGGTNRSIHIVGMATGRPNGRGPVDPRIS